LIRYYEDNHEELYNLRTDLSEKTDVAGQNPALVKKLSTELTTYLKKVNARLPEKDPQYSLDDEKKTYQDVVSNRLPQLEKQRQNYLSRDFDPKNNWWKSAVTKD
jgi:hypothetical protein